jgi:mannose-1-phosphate guanylyltransferase
LTAAALWLLARDPDAVMLVLPSDHVVQDIRAFREAAAASAAQAGLLVTFGVAPRAPETGFGYIAAGAPVEGLDGVRHVAGFVENPTGRPPKGSLRAATISGTAACSSSAPTRCSPRSNA